MPGLIVKPRRDPRHRKTELKRQRVPPGRVCVGDPMKQCRKKPVRRLPGGTPDEYACVMHFWRYRRYGGNYASEKEYKTACAREVSARTREKSE